MAIQIIDLLDAPAYRNPGKVSVQILCPETAPDALATITRVTMTPGAISALHSHASSEQTWIIEKGEGMLLLAGDLRKPVAAGTLVRTPPGTEHGLVNTGDGDLVYLAVTTPPEGMAKFYSEHDPI